MKRGTHKTAAEKAAEGTADDMQVLPPLPGHFFALVKRPPWADDADFDGWVDTLKHGEGPRLVLPRPIATPL